MLCAFDIDGTISSNPYEFSGLMTALHAAGHVVVVISGHDAPEVTQDDWNRKAKFLASLGCAENWDTLVVLPDAGSLAELKAQWLSDNGATCFFDNNVKNIKAANAAGIN